MRFFNSFCSWESVLYVYVCVCVCFCVYVCVFVCLYYFAVKASSVCNDVWDIPEGTDQRTYVVSIILGALAKFFHLRF